MDKRKVAMLRVADECEQKGRFEEAEEWRCCARMYFDEYSEHGTAEKLIFLLTMGVVILSFVSLILPIFGDVSARWLQ